MSESASRRRPATVRDVAAMAEVSPGTVSKALNGTGKVRAETRDRIQAAAAALDFRPNDLARSVFERRSYTVGVITTDSFERFSLPVMLGVEDALGAGQISVFLSDSRGDPIRERHYVDQLLKRRVDGFVVTGRSSNARPPITATSGVPVVYALTPSSDPADCSVVVDDHAAGFVAGEYLVDLGRRRIGHITGPQSFDAAVRRADGFSAALAAADLQPAGEILCGGWTESWGRQAAEILLRSTPDLDAVHCGSDLIARGVMETIHEHGKRIPADIAVTGTDNWEIIAEGARPQLTTVDLELATVGRVAAQRLLDAIAGNPHHGIEQVDCRLVVRESTGRAES